MMGNDMEMPEQDNEVELEGTPKADIEIIDDTPERDRGKVARGEVPDITEDELESYGNKVQERIRGLNRKFHDERRVKEAVTREREELTNYSKNILEENRRLKHQLASGSEVFIAKSISESEALLDSAKREYREAYENGDTDKLIAAQEKMSRAVASLEESKRLRPLTVPQEPEYIPQHKQELPRLSPRTQEWVDKNEWFGPNRRMTALAFAIHADLVEDGVEEGSEEYYRHIDKTMRETFPQFFETERRNGNGQQVRSRPNVVVAPASRSHAVKKVTLTRSQEAIANRLGVPLEEYAKQVALLAEANASGRGDQI